MAESLAALGVASNIVQFVELGFNITKAVIETYRSTDVNGLAERNVDLGAMTSSLKDRFTLLQDDATAKADPITMGLLKQCIKVANELLSELEGLKMSAADRHRSLTKFIVSVKAYWKKSKIEDLATRITDIRKEIFRRLEPLLNDHRKSLSEAMRSLGDASAAWNNATEKRLDSIARDLERLLVSNAAVPSSVDLGVFANQLSKFADEAKHRGNIRTIIKSLHFAQIKERQNEIPQAHRNTFHWIFDESISTGFATWLHCPSEGVFWITGKPGSGKSTLMKLILGHETTKVLAERWAGPKPLVLVSHFFWSVGNKIQTSQEGLLRTLLFQIMVQCPQIIPEICSERYSDSLKSLESWSIEELSQTFERIQHIQELPIRVLLLIDGLDEFSGEPREVTNLLRAVTSSPDIKVCCASRPWRDFLEAFGESPWNLEIHNLTRKDILRYTEDNLSDDARFKAMQQLQEERCQNLVQAICDKADGVFFWVSLVVKSLLRGLRNQDDIEMLYRRLNELPSDLRSFFQRMLESIEGVYVEAAFSIFTSLLVAKTPLPSDLFWCFDKLRMSTTSKLSIFKFTGKGRLDARSHELLQIKGYTAHILDICRDLVQARETVYGYRIGFIHRTVFEFLLQAPSLRQFSRSIPTGPHCLFLMACIEHAKKGHPMEGGYEAVLRICHFLQELEFDTLPSQQSIWNGLCDLRNRLPDSKVWHVQDSHRIFGHAQAHFLSKLDRPLPGSSMGVDCADIVAEILRGSVHVDVADIPEVTLSDRIDTSLLADILRIYKATLSDAESKIDRFWAQFVREVASPGAGHPPPTNAIQACKIFVEHGARRRVPLYLMFQEEQLGGVLQRLHGALMGADVDVVNMLQSSPEIDNVGLTELKDLFPAEVLTIRIFLGFSRVFGWLKRTPTDDNT